MRNNRSLHTEIKVDNNDKEDKDKQDKKEMKWMR